MITTLAILDFAARACPAHMEATFFALFMSVYNAGMKLSRVLGDYIYDELGYTALIMISAAAMAVLWIILPLLKLPEQQKD
jgi:predicted MFS family arabinose efflux permease